MTDQSNSAKMTLEERVAQRIKNSELGQFFDEDDLSAVVQRAITEAFFKPRVEPGNSYSYNRKELPPLAVELATAAFSEQFRALVKPAVEQLFANAEFREAVSQTIFSAIYQHADKHIQNVTSQAVYDMFMSNRDGLATMIAQMIRSQPQ